MFSNLLGRGIKMEKLREEILSLEKSCKLVQNELQKIYEGRKEYCIKKYIKNNVKQGYIFWLTDKRAWNQELEFKELSDTDIVFWNKTFNRVAVFTLYEFLQLEKEELVVKE